LGLIGGAGDPAPAPSVVFAHAPADVSRCFPLISSALSTVPARAAYESVVIMMLSSALRRRALFTILLLALFLGGAAEAFAVKSPMGRRANARKLLRIADGASQRMIQDGRGRLDRDPQARAFWEALLRMDSQIDQIGMGLKSRDLSFFKSLRSGTAALAELQVTWALAQAKGVKDSAVDRNLRTLAAAHNRLRDRYGPEWVRFQSGRPLNEDEKIRFARMRAEQARLAGKIEVLHERAEAAGDTATADELAHLLNQVHGIASASPTLGDYLDASVATDAIRGAWYGARSEHAVDEEGWADADRVVSEITTGEEVGFVFTTDLEKVDGWSFVEEETDIPSAIAQSAIADTEMRDEGLSPGQVIDLEEPEAIERGETEIGDEGEIQILETVILDESPEDVWSEEGEVEEESDVEDVEVWSGEPGETAPEDLPREPTPADGSFEEEDMEVEDIPVPPAGPEEGSVPPAVSSPPPALSPAPASSSLSPRSTL
jgi:hypothetical protein